MIKPVSPVKISQNLKTKLTPKSTQKVTRKIVDLQKSELKGITKTPIRLAEKIDPDSQAAISGLVSSGAAVFASWMAIL